MMRGALTGPAQMTKGSLSKSTLMRRGCTYRSCTNEKGVQCHANAWIVGFCEGLQHRQMESKAAKGACKCLQ
eukprot:131253-Pelagomonas_calceolata.AAC.6